MQGKEDDKVGMVIRVREGGEGGGRVKEVRQREEGEEMEAVETKLKLVSG